MLKDDSDQSRRKIFLGAKMSARGLADLSPEDKKKHEAFWAEVEKETERLLGGGASGDLPPN
jgi:hypothetical protein